MTPAGVHQLVGWQHLKPRFRLRALCKKYPLPTAQLISICLCTLQKTPPQLWSPPLIISICLNTLQKTLPQLYSLPQLISLSLSLSLSLSSCIPTLSNQIRSSSPTPATTLFPLFSRHRCSLSPLPLWHLSPLLTSPVVTSLSSHLSLRGHFSPLLAYPVVDAFSPLLSRFGNLSLLSSPFPSREKRRGEKESDNSRRGKGRESGKRGERALTREERREINWGVTARVFCAKLLDAGVFFLQSYSISALNTDLRLRCCPLTPADKLH